MRLLQVISDVWGSASLPGLPLKFYYDDDNDDDDDNDGDNHEDTSQCLDRGF